MRSVRRNFASGPRRGSFRWGLATCTLPCCNCAGLATVFLPRSDFQIAGRGLKHGVRMRPAATLSGRVTDRAGKPVVRAVVAAGSLAGYFAVAGFNAVESDAEGRFTLTNLPAFNRAAAFKLRANQNQWALAANRDMSKMYSRIVDPAEDTSISNLVVTHPDYAVTTVRGGDVPGTTDVVMAPAAAIEGRVVEFGTGAPTAGVTVKAAGAPMPVAAEEVGAAGESGFQLFFNETHQATTRTDADGRYRLANLPEGKYDVWAELSSGTGTPTERIGRGLKGIEARASGSSTKVPELVIGPGGVVRGQLIDASTGRPLLLGEESGLAIATTMFVEPMLQQLPVERVPVIPDGRFELRLPPGKVRVYLSVQKGGGAVEPQGDFRSSDDTFQFGPVFDLAHGESREAEFTVWPWAMLREARARLVRGFERLKEHKYDEAIAEFNALILADNGDLSALNGRAQAFEQSGRIAAAVTDYETLVRLQPDDTGEKPVGRTAGDVARGERAKRRARRRTGEAGSGGDAAKSTERVCRDLCAHAAGGSASRGRRLCRGRGDAACSDRIVDGIGARQFA